MKVSGKATRAVARKTPPSASAATADTPAESGRSVWRPRRLSTQAMANQDLLASSEEEEAPPPQEGKAAH